MKTSAIANPFLTDKNTTHSYCEQFYDTEFEKYQDKPISLLEVGVLHGGSMLLWDTYFPNAEKIVGLDNDLSFLAKQNLKFSDRVHIVNTDAYTQETAGSLGQFDIIIDDGPHTLESQIKLLELYCSHLKLGGILVIEDVQWPDRKDSLIAATPEAFKPGIQWLDLTRIKGCRDDLLFIVRN